MSTTKKVSIGVRPTNKPTTQTADAWVENRGAAGEMKRLTIDVPIGLHRIIKMQCAARGKKIADEVRELLSQKYGVGK